MLWTWIKEYNQGMGSRCEGSPPVAHEAPPAELRRAGDGLQRPLRFRFQPRLTPSVRLLEAGVPKRNLKYRASASRLATKHWGDPVSSRTVVRIILCTLSLLTMALAAVAQPPAKIPQVGVLHNGRQADEPRLRVLEEFRHGLHDLGYVEGQNIALESRWAEGSLERLPALAAELVHRQVDVLVVFGPPGVRAARAATSTIPIVMARMDDAEEHGFVASLARPGGNITGLSFQTGALSGKWLEVLKDAVPSASRVAVLWDATGTVNQRRALEYAAQAVGIQLHVVEIQSLSALAGAFEAAQTAQAEGLVILASPVFSQNASRLAELALQHRLPAIYYSRRFADAGGLLAYGPHGADPSWGWRRAAVYVDKLLKGAKPGDLPVEQPLKFELVINLKTAQALGLTIPPMLLFRADEVIR